MHYAYVDGKRVSNYLMRDYWTFLKLQEAIGSKQAEGQKHEYAGAPRSIAYDTPPPAPLPSRGSIIKQEQPNSGNQSNGGYIQSKGHRAAMI
jgi:hypothetical protein